MIVKLKFSHKEKKIYYENTVIDATCEVRSLKNTKRKSRAWPIGSTLSKKKCKGQIRTQERGSQPFTP